MTENSGDVAKYVTKPDAYLKLDGSGAWWRDPERLETLHYAPGNKRAVGAWSLSKIRRKLGVLRDDKDDVEDLIDIGEDDDEQECIPPREVQYRWRRGEEGHMAY